MAVATVPLSQHGNAWSSQSVGANALSPIFDTIGAPFISVFGNVGGATTVQVYASADGVNFYSAGTAHQFVAAGITDFVLDFQAAARYLQLKCTGAVTITATVSGKP